MYKIATLNKISPAGLSRLTDDYEIVENLEDANGLLLRSYNLHETNLPSGLKAIGRAGAGVNNIPLARCADQGIVVFNAPGANANAVKELTISGLFLAARNLPDALAWAKTITQDVGKSVEKGKGQFAGTEIKGKTLGVIGLGAIGVMVANAAQSLGMDVIGYDPFLSVRSALELSGGIGIVDKPEDMYPECDYISIHVPVMDQTKGMIDKNALAQMKDGVFFLNFARDKLVNDDDMLTALSSGKVKKYITDFPNDTVLGKEGVIAVPHLGASSAEAEENCASMAVDEIMDYLENGNITNSVNYPACSLGTKKGSRVCVLSKNDSGLTGKIAAAITDVTGIISKIKGEYAYTLAELSGTVDEAKLKAALNMDGIIAVRVIK